MKCCDIVIIDFEEYTDLEFREVSSFFIKNAMGQKVYFKTRDRIVAQYTCDEMFGKNHYKVNSGKMGKKPDNESAVGRLSSKSRQGLKTRGKG